AELHPKTVALVAQAYAPDRGLDPVRDGVQLRRRLLDVILGADPQRFHRGTHRGIGRHHDACTARLPPAEVAQHFDAVDSAAQVLVHQRRVELLLAHQLERALSRRSAHCREAGGAERLPQQPDQLWFVVDDEDLLHCRARQPRGGPGSKAWRSHLCPPSGILGSVVNRTATLRRLLSLARPEWKLLGAGVLFLGLGSAMALLYPQGMRIIIDGVLGGGSPAQIDRAALFMVLVALLQAVAVSARFTLISLAGERAVTRIREQLFSGILDQEIGFFDRRRTGELTSRLASDTAVLQSAVSANISIGLRSVAQIAGASFMASGSFAAYAAAAVVFWYGGRLVLRGEMTVGGLTSFLVYTLIVAFSLGALADLWADFMRSLGAAERIFELLDRTPEMAPSGGVVLPQVRGEVALEDVRFAYPSRKDVLVIDRVSLRLSPDEVVAVVGPSGAGKSTLAALIARLYDPDEGRLRLDGRDLRDLDVGFLRRQIGTVAQEPILFS